jgi:hypothetical protein
VVSGTLNRNFSMVVKFGSLERPGVSNNLSVVVR